jgi:hypothetical protein
MLISKEFVFIHMPKTGGTFVHGVFKKIIKEYKRKHPLDWYFNRFLYRLKLVRPIYQKLDNIEYHDYPNHLVRGQHAGVNYIPKQFKNLPVISVKRDPVEQFISNYYFRWWERIPYLNYKLLIKLFPSFPNLSNVEYFELAYVHEMNFFFQKDYREDIGVLSWHFIRMYCKDPMFVYKNINADNFEKFKADYFVEVKFFEMQDLNESIKKYIENTSFAEYAHHFVKSDRIYPPGSKPELERQEITFELKKRIKEKEWLLYRYFQVKP